MGSGDPETALAETQRRGQKVQGGGRVRMGLLYETGVP